VPVRTAIGKSAHSAAEAHQPEKDASQRAATSLICIGGRAELGQAEAERVANDDDDEANEPDLRDR